MLFYSHEAEHTSEICINQKIEKKKKINPRCYYPGVGNTQLRSTRLKQHLRL